MTIEDDGIGIDPKIIEELDGRMEKSIGLKNVHNRIKLMYGKGLVIESLEKDMDSTMRIMQSDEQKVLSLANNEKELLESLFNDDHLITRSMGTITDSKLIVQKDH